MIAEAIEIPTNTEFLLYSFSEPSAKRCDCCGGLGTVDDPHGKTYRAPDGATFKKQIPCEACEAVGWFGINPRVETPARPGSAAKVAVLAARYRAIEQAGIHNAQGGFVSVALQATGIVPFHPDDWIDPEEAHKSKSDRRGFYPARAG